MASRINENIMLHMAPVMTIIFVCLGVISIFRSIHYYRRLKKLLQTSSAGDGVDRVEVATFGEVIAAALSNKRDADTNILMARAGLTRWLMYAVTSPPAAAIIWFLVRPEIMHIAGGNN